MQAKLASTDHADWLTISVQSLDQYPDAILQIYNEEIPGMLIKQAFPASEMRVLSQKKLQNVEAHPTCYGETIGLSLSQKITSKFDYFQEAIQLDSAKFLRECPSDKGFSV